MNAPTVLGSLSRRGCRAELVASPAQHATRLDVVVVNQEAVEEDLECRIRSGELLVHTEDGLVPS